MPKVAVAGSLLEGGTGGGDVGLKRVAGGAALLFRLKRRKNGAEVVDRFPSPTLPNSRMDDTDFSKPEPLKSTRMAEVFPSTKPFNRMKWFCPKVNSKMNNTDNLSVEEGVGINNSALPSTLNGHMEINSTENLAASTSNVKEIISQQGRTTGICSEVRYRSVSELSQGINDQVASSQKVDMDKAFRGFATLRPTDCGLPFDSFRKNGEPISSFTDVRCPVLFVSGTKVPLDFTLKTKMRVVSSSPISWFHRVLMSGTYNGMTTLPAQFGKNQKINGVSDPSPSTIDNGHNSLCSWIYPHSSLPPSVISALSMTTGGESDFLTKRHRDWEDSFRNLYYMLRKNACDIFYVCTSQFIVLFTAFGAGGKTKKKCNAYISQSTRGLRSSLKEHDVCFSMPLCLSEVEQTCREDLVELSEIEKHNLGQTKRRNLMSDVDNSPESLLAFDGNENTHGLYDFLLNYRSFVTSLTGSDVPTLCAPVPFRNAAASMPEISCKEIKTVDFLASKFDSSMVRDDSAVADFSGSVYYSIEITDRFITPWAMGSICATIGTKGRSFEASFTIEPNSLGLNVALDAIDQNIDPQDSIKEKPHETDCPLGMKAVVSSELRSAWIKLIKCCNGNYTATLDPI